MLYFLTRIADASTGTHPTDDSGRFVDHAGSPKPWEVQRAFVRVPLFDDERDVETADALCDAITLGLDWLVSKRVVETLKTTAIDPNIGFLPTIVRNRKGEVLATYYLHTMRSGLPASESVTL
jgi:hypothetical protein